MMTVAAAIDFVSVFFAGLLAGTEVVIHYGFRRPSETLDEHAQLVLRQAMVRRLRVLVPAFFVPTAVAGIAVTLIGSGTHFWFRLAALLALLLWILIRVIGTIPINSATLDWPADVPPKNWKALVERAERFHDVGVWAAIVAFAGLLIPNMFH